MVSRRQVTAGLLGFILSSPFERLWGATKKPSPKATVKAKVSKKPSPTPSPTKFVPPEKQKVSITLGESQLVKVNETHIFYPTDFAAHGKGFIVTRTANGLICVDNICTHEGCSVVSDKNVLVCYCHLSYFNPSGDVISGPARLGLKQYDISEHEGIISITDLQ